MKLLQVTLISFLLGMTMPAHANDQDVQADFLLAKISTALKNDRTSEALSACAKLEKLGPSLTKPLPEIFYFNYIDAMHRSGVKEGILNRAYAYLENYGKAGPHFVQVTAFVREQQMAAEREGKVDADAAVIAWKEAYLLQKEQEHEQTLTLLRACQGEAITLEGKEKEISAAFAAIDAQSDALLTRKAALEQRVTLLDRSRQMPPEERKEMIDDFNRNSQAYNDAVLDFNVARLSYDTKVDEQNRRRKGYEARCTDITINAYELDEVCGKSADWFCSNIE